GLQRPHPLGDPGREVVPLGAVEDARHRLERERPLLSSDVERDALVEVAAGERVGTQPQLVGVERTHRAVHVLVGHADAVGAVRLGPHHLVPGGSAGVALEQIRHADEPAARRCRARVVDGPRPPQPSSTRRGGSVAASTSSVETPGASSRSTSPSVSTSITARSVITRSTTPRPVSGSEHSCTIFGLPSLATCSISTITRLAPCTRSMAPPGPLTIFPGIIQFARSPRAETCMPPRIAASILP